MTSTRERQRAAARARLEKEMAERKAAAHKRRQRNAALGGGAALLAVVLIVVGVVNLVNDDEEDTASPAPSTTASANPAPNECAWAETPKEQRSPTTKDVGLPSTTKPPRKGTQVMTIQTSVGTIDVTMDLSKSPCTSASFSHLASKNFFDGTKCHRILPGLLQCGDPSTKGKGYRESDGTGGPTYSFNDENLPTAQPAYPAGVVAMANGGPNTNGSQFFLVYKDVELQPAYTVIGKISKGMDVLTNATKAGHDGAFEPSPGGGHPKKEVIIKDLTVSAAK